MDYLKASSNILLATNNRNITGSIKPRLVMELHYHNPTKLFIMKMHSILLCEILTFTACSKDEDSDTISGGVNREIKEMQTAILTGVLSFPVATSVSSS